MKLAKPLSYLTLLLVLAPNLCFGQERPNILLIVADDMGYGDLSCYGSLQIQTPNLDSLAENGVRFTNGYVSSSVCSPSRAGLITGRSGSRFGYEHNLHLAQEHTQPEFIGIPLDEPLLSERLKTLGYRTGLVGKWHLGESVPEHHPNERGFDYFFGMLNGSHNYWPTLKKNRLLRNNQKLERIATPYLTDWFTLEAKSFIRDSAKEENPWFLFLSYNTPHSPMQAKEEDIAKYAHIKNEKRRIYCAMQHCMDANIGTIVDELKETGQLENTLIAFISDNGGSIEVSHAVNAPLRGGKGTFFEGGIRIPTIYHWPAALKPSIYEHPVTSLDLMATFVSAAGGTPPPPGKRQEREGREKKGRPIYDSVNLLPFLTGKTEGPPHETLFWRMALRGSAVRDGSWKFLRANNLLPRLFDLSVDVGESNNLIEKHPEIAERLLAKLNSWEATLERNPVVISTPNWSAYNRRLYERTYSLTQPKPEHEKDIWSLKANRN